MIAVLVPRNCGLGEQQLVAVKPVLELSRELRFLRAKLLGLIFALLKVMEAPTA